MTIKKDRLNTVLNKLLKIMFQADYYTDCPDEIDIGVSRIEQKFAVLMRSPRFGFGYKKLGRKLFELTNTSFEDILYAGRADDLLHIHIKNIKYQANFIFYELKKGNYYIKKWLPRLSAGKKSRIMAKELCKLFNITEKDYRKLIKLETTPEYLLSHKESINYETVPSRAMMKYYIAFLKDPAFIEYLGRIKKKQKRINVNGITPYDIYKNRYNIDADHYSQLTCIQKINCIPVIDTGIKMIDKFDSYSKATSLGYYLSKCSQFYQNNFITFSNHAKIDKLEGISYNADIADIQKGTYSSCVDIKNIMELFKDTSKPPEFLVFLSNMDFNTVPDLSKEKLLKEWNKNKYRIKIVWWNVGGKKITAPQIDGFGNIYMSGYNPFMLRLLKFNFDGKKYLKKLLESI